MLYKFYKLSECRNALTSALILSGDRDLIMRTPKTLTSKFTGCHFKSLRAICRRKEGDAKLL